MMSANMMPPSDTDRGEAYSVPRGVCPFCSSGEVMHLAIGMPSGPESGLGDPEWVRWVGCVHPGFSRQCSSCEGTWSDVEGLGPAYLAIGSLMERLDARSIDDLADQLSERFELDAWARAEEAGVEIGFLNTAVLIEFPVGIDDFWETLNELHDEVSEQLELDDSDDS